MNELLDIYRQCFDEQFDRHEGFISSTIQRLRGDLSTSFIEELNTQIQQAGLTIQAYPELSTRDDSKLIISKINQTHANILTLLDETFLQVNKTIAEFGEKISLKLAKPVAVPFVLVIGFTAVQAA